MGPLAENNPSSQTPKYSQYPSIAGSDDKGKRHTGAVLSGSLRGS